MPGVCFYLQTEPLFNGQSLDFFAVGVFNRRLNPHKLNPLAESAGQNDNHQEHDDAA